MASMLLFYLNTIMAFHLTQSKVYFLMVTTRSLILLYLPLLSHLLSPIALRCNHTGLHATKFLLHGLCSCRSMCLEWSSFTYLNGSFLPVSLLNIIWSDSLSFTAINQHHHSLSCFISHGVIFLHNTYYYMMYLSDSDSELNRCSMSAKILFCSFKFLQNQKQCLIHARI